MAQVLIVDGLFVGSLNHCVAFCLYTSRANSFKILSEQSADAFCIRASREVPDGGLRILKAETFKILGLTRFDEAIPRDEPKLLR